MGRKRKLKKNKDDSRKDDKDQKRDPLDPWNKNDELEHPAFHRSDLSEMEAYLENFPPLDQQVPPQHSKGAFETSCSKRNHLKTSSNVQTFTIISDVKPSDTCYSSHGKDAQSLNMEDWNDKNNCYILLRNSRNLKDSKDIVTQVKSTKTKNKLSGRKQSGSPDRGNVEGFCDSKSKPISFETLEALIAKEPNEILLEVCKNASLMSLFEGGEEIDTDRMALILITLGKTCAADLDQESYTFLNYMQGKTHFLMISVPIFLVSLDLDSMKNYHLESVSSLITFLKKFQHTLPSSAYNVVSVLIPLLKAKCEIILKGCTFYNDAKDELKYIEEQNECFKQQTRSNIKNPSEREALQSIDPTESFRSLSIFPNVGDIYCGAFLRPNIVNGKYVDTEHYLDVQFRLLREDFVSPLRHGIAEYVELKSRGKSVTECKNAMVYENVRIVKEEYVKGNMYHLVKFSDEVFRSMKWAHNKCLLWGQLLCLSSDNFKSILFASVARRDIEEMKNGLLLIHFEEIPDQKSSISAASNFVVIETAAYFEAYRHNLKALQELNEDALPLKEYIINVNTDIKHPHYLDSFTTYDIRPLLLPMDSTCIKREVTDGDNLSFEYKFPDDCDIGKSVLLLNDSSWPSVSDINLESSQYLALKAALTRELAIIQGPPGTGKTYVALRIVQILLHNIDKWFTKETNSLPILVISLTNHALDQFLEGIMSFTDKIVRVGGQAKNFATHQFLLNNVKKCRDHKMLLPEHIRTNLWFQSQHVRSIETDIEELNDLLLNSTKRVLSEENLFKYIPEIQYHSLKSVVHLEEYGIFGKIDDGLVIYDWLGIRPRFGTRHNFSGAEDEVADQVTNSESSVEEINNEIDSIDKVKIVEDINEDGFVDVSFGTAFLPSDNGHCQGVKERRLKYIRNWLHKSEALEETEASNISNVWDLDLPQRWKLYKYWLELMAAKIQEQCMTLQDELKKAYEELCETKTEEDIHVLKRAHVVGMTTTGAAKYRHLVQRLNPQIIIVEEAAEILESHMVTLFAPNTQHVILIGDHQQLRPSPSAHELTVKYGMDVSFFERMIKNKMGCQKLSTQYRMRPEITDLIVPHIYTELKNDLSVTEFESIKGVCKNVFFITHDCSEAREKFSKSRVNIHEATFIIKLCNYLVQQGYDSSQITVLATYNGQLSVMKEMAGSFPMTQNVRFDVVDNYQGEENDIVLISLVRSNDDGNIGFLKVSNRVCVSLSRAKKGLYCIGDFELLAQKSNLWKNITETLKQKGEIGQSLKFFCQNHPNVFNEVSTEKDFESVPEGGCAKKCDYRLSCGHACPLMCHPYDQKHTNVRCLKDCNRTCENGHKCPKRCFETCGPCEYVVSRPFFSCGHTIEVPCGKQSSNILCTAGCDRKLKCGHECPKQCSEICADLCTKIISVESPICGHIVPVECSSLHSSKELLENCTHPCDAILKCGHKCNGNCKDCHQGRLHVACNQPCNRILVCGHECKSPCAITCPPCKLPCQNRCIHSKCPRKCGEPCDMCAEKCEWHCEHKSCSRLCGQLCSRVPCDEPCCLILKCGHPCIGFCGEPCPEICRVCDREAVREIFFGTEEEDDARFIQLEDCNHILEISGLNEWMKSKVEDNHVQMNVCPKCKTVVRRSLRFGNIVKSCLKKIEKVKEKTFGTVDSNNRLQQSLLTLVEKNRILLSKLKSGPFSLYESWKMVLSSQTCRSIQEITLMENIIAISLHLADLHFNDMSYVEQVPAVTEAICVLTHFVLRSKRFLIEFMHDEFLTASEQQLVQLSWEDHRLKLASKFLNFTAEHSIKFPNTDFEECVRILTNNCSFGESDVDKFSKSFQALRTSFGYAVINVSDMEKELILKAMNLSLGHWYQCSNGHVYCITECGGAMEESRCIECQANIGGSSHSLFATNRVATDMDGATYSAWSEEANLQNPIFVDFEV